ncbi:hypothetical protein Dsin_027028 [Dipteronia sinensis]|uniref:Reverse transcriptase zinc-binding domain-containing protein n=1 Tax=Dipteronia sinensis TaxID=43782 RepID=A0AAE0A0B6_9ROSI|nr:hypothetical protein Dsin_027028 [Dipteronia sinensis]
MVKEVMYMFGFDPVGLKCVLCNLHDETIDHLFLHRDWSWKVWKAAMGWWEVEFCASRTINDWFLGWSSLNPLQCTARAWQILFSAVVWSLWEARNNRIFKNSKVLIHQVVDMVRFMLVWWFKHCGKWSKDQVSLMLLNVKDRCVNLPIPKKSRSAH